MSEKKDNQPGASFDYNAPDEVRLNKHGRPKGSGWKSRGPAGKSAFSVIVVFSLTLNAVGLDCVFSTGSDRQRVEKEVEKKNKEEGVIIASSESHNYSELSLERCWQYKGVMSESGDTLFLDGKLKNQILVFKTFKIPSKSSTLLDKLYKKYGKVNPLHIDSFKYRAIVIEELE